MTRIKQLYNIQIDLYSLNNVFIKRGQLHKLLQFNKETEV